MADAFDHGLSRSPAPAIIRTFVWSNTRLQGSSQDHPAGRIEQLVPDGVVGACRSHGPADKLGKLVEEQWAELKDTDDIDEVASAAQEAPEISVADPAVFGVFRTRKSGQPSRSRQQAAGTEKCRAEDLKLPEWEVFSNPESAAENRDFKLKRVAPPKGFEVFFEDTVLVERIREVRALLGFTRIESNADFAEATMLKDGRLTKLCRESPTWLPASEVRGEGIFLRIREEALLAWQEQVRSAAAPAGVS